MNDKMKITSDKELTFHKTVLLWGPVSYQLIPERTVRWSDLGDASFDELLRQVKEHGCEYNVVHTLHKVVEVGS